MPTLKEIYLMPFHALAVATRVFLRNRSLSKGLTRKPRVAMFLRYAMLATLVIWLAIAAFTRDNDDGRLTDAIKSLWSDTSDERAQITQPPDDTPPATDLPDASPAPPRQHGTVPATVHDVPGPVGGDVE